jgi:hypothetical protein
MRQFVQQLCSEAAVVRFAASEAAFTLLTVDDVTMKQLHFQNPTSEFTSRSWWPGACHAACGVSKAVLPVPSNRCLLNTEGKCD